MTETTTTVKSGSLAPLKNVSGFMVLVSRLQNRGPHLPNLGVMYGPSGLGKSYASIFAQNKTRAVRVEVGESWNRRTFVLAILQELGCPDLRGVTADLVRRAIGLLSLYSDRPLIIDEADKLVDKGLIEIVREVGEASQVPVVLIGEENLPSKLMRVERVHNRVLDWYAAQPCDSADCRLLAGIFLTGVAISDELLEQVRIKGDGRARRIVVSLSAMAEFARNRGLKTLDSRSYEGQLFTGETPRARTGRLLGRASA
jgi:DNA transposition AAA+ family ATPase